MTHTRKRFTIFVIAVFAVVGSRFATADQVEEARLADMADRVRKTTAHSPNQLGISEQPIFRYSDPTRNILDATIWKLGKQGRPRGILVLEYYTQDGGYWSYEMTALSDSINKRFEFHTGSDSWDWRPDPSKLSWVQFDVDHEPAESLEERYAQIKHLVRRLRANEEFYGTSQLRLMPRPLAKYVDEKNGILAGCIYTLAHRTNAELLVMIEAQRDSEGSTKWVARFARLGIARFDVTFNGKTFWSVGYHDAKSKEYQSKVVKDPTHMQNR